LPRLKPAPGYITAKEAITMLDISDATLSQYVKNGWLKRYGPPERKHKFYKLSEIEALIASRNVFGEYQEKLPASFSPATPQDIPAIADIDERTFNANKKEKAEPKEAYIHWVEAVYLNWLQKNPETFFVLRNTANKIVAFAALVPIKKNSLDCFVKGEIKMSEIPSDDIEAYEPGKPLHLYVIALCIDPVYRAGAKVAYAFLLIEKLFAFLLDLARRGVEIETITARNEKDKPDGKRLLQKLGIPQLRSPIPDIHLFSVRVADSGYPKLVQYSDTLAQWKREHPTSKE
jgi:hypothetical protein